MLSTAPRHKYILEGLIMEERTYKVLGGTGALNLTFGVISIVVGLTAGIHLIISGAKLLGSRRNVII